jgi:cytoskeletal protein CcmA (bactofilin family)
VQFKRRMEEAVPEVPSVERVSLNVPSPGFVLAKRNGLAPRAVITPDIHIFGSVQTDAEIEIEGQVEGDVRCGHLTVGKSGAITGDITAHEVVIRGKVQGAIHASRIILQAGAHVEGDINYDKLSIEEEAYFKGASTPNDSGKTASPTLKSLRSPENGPPRILDEIAESAPDCGIGRTGS